MRQKKGKCIFAFCFSLILIAVFAAPAVAAEKVNVNLTQAEHEYLREKKNLKVAVVDDWLPYIYKDNTSSTYEGFAVDLLNILSSNSGISIEYISAPNYMEAGKLLEEGSVDIVAIAQKRGAITEIEDGFIPYMTALVQVIIRKEAVALGQDKVTMAVPEGIEYFNLDDYTNIQAVEYDTREECLQAVRGKQADFTVSELYTAEPLADYFLTKDLITKNIPEHYVTMGFMTKPSEITLQKILMQLKGSLPIGKTGERMIFHEGRLQGEEGIVSYVYKHPFELLCVVFSVLVTVVIILFTYVRVRIRQHSTLEGYEKSYRMLADTFGQAGMEYDFLNDRLTLFGEKHDTIDIPEIVDNLHEKLRRRALRITLTEEEFDRVVSNTEQGKTYQTEFQCGMRGNGWNWFSMIYIVVCTEESHRRPIRLVGCLVDAQEQHQTQEMLVELGQYDKLTGVYNRVGAEAQMIEALQRIKEYSQNIFLLMDVDRFKQINDGYGHLCGDDVLRNIGNNIQEIFQGDTIICRWGGDEFIMFVRGPGAEEGLLCKRIEELRRRMKSYQYEGECYPIGLSIGGIIPREGMTLESLFKQADDVLYEVKEKGRDNFLLRNASEEE